MQTKIMILIKFKSLTNLISFIQKFKQPSVYNATEEFGSVTPPTTTK